MELRMSGKEGVASKTFAAWISEPSSDKQILNMILGDLKVTVFPYDKNQIRRLGEKLIELSGV